MVSDKVQHGRATDIAILSSNILKLDPNLARVSAVFVLFLSACLKALYLQSVLAWFLLFGMFLVAMHCYVLLSAHVERLGMLLKEKHRSETLPLKTRFLTALAVFYLVALAFGAGLVIPVLTSI